MEMTTTLAMTMSRLRIAIGAGALVAPGTAARLMSGEAESRGLEPLFARMLGARDLALGLGALVALDHGAPVRGWLEGAALADTADAVAAVLARRRLTPAAFAGTVGIAAGAAVAGALLARRLDPAPEPHPGQPEAIVTGHHAVDPEPEA
jgi:hypothetical protein